MRGFKLDLKSVWRTWARAERANYAAQVAAYGGGSLAREVRRVRIRIKTWGYVVGYSMNDQRKARAAEKAAAAAEGRAPARVYMGQVLTWYVRGTRERRHKTRGQRSVGRVRAHPVEVRPQIAAMVAQAEARMKAQFAAWERRAVA